MINFSPYQIKKDQFKSLFTFPTDFCPEYLTCTPRGQLFKGKNAKPLICWPKPKCKGRILPKILLLLHFNQTQKLSLISMAEPPTCNCGVPARVKTSWTTENPGKRFYGCAYYEVSVPDFCFFFLLENVKFEEVILNSIMWRRLWLFQVVWYK